MFIGRSEVSEERQLTTIGKSTLCNEDREGYTLPMRVVYVREREGKRGREK